MTDVPMPDTAHPDWTRYVDLIRAHLDQGQPLLVHEPGDEVLRDDYRHKFYMDIKTFAGPAPATIDATWQEAAYVWRAALDHRGRWVAGPATLHIRERRLDPPPVECLWCPTTLDPPARYQAVVGDEVIAPLCHDCYQIAIA